ncbi:MAG: histidine kinase [Methylophilaceae bacterium]
MRKSTRLPNLRNLGIILRILVIVNAALALVAIVMSIRLNDFFSSLANLSTVAQPLLLVSLLLLYGSYALLSKMSYWFGVVSVFVLVLLVCSGMNEIFSQIVLFSDMPSRLRILFFAFFITAFSLYYFNLREHAYSPAVSEARLQALQARIRPHFLFNCINAVLSLIRSQPKRAEAALEDMADLFRVLMADNRDLVPLAQEISLCRQYLALEKLRMEERLIVNWQIDNMPPDAMIPPLILQPLIENAVYHGIEPLANGGTITIQIYTSRKEVHVVLSNPYAEANMRHNGNKIALKNIKERLALHFDLEASLKSSQKHDEYQVHIILPYKES